MEYVLQAFCACSFANFNYSDEKNFFLRAKKKELDLRLESVEKSIEILTVFNPLNYKKLFSSWVSHLLPNKTITNLSNEIQTALLKKFQIDRSKLEILIGSKKTCFEHVDIIKKHDCEQIVIPLLKRRKELLK